MGSSRYWSVSSQLQSSVRRACFLESCLSLSIPDRQPSLRQSQGLECGKQEGQREGERRESQLWEHQHGQCMGSGPFASQCSLPRTGGEKKDWPTGLCLHLSKLGLGLLLWSHPLGTHRVSHQPQWRSLKKESGVQRKVAGVKVCDGRLVIGACDKML